MDLEQRMARLERGNRRMKRIGALGLVVAAVVLLSGAAKGKELEHLEVSSLTLKDEDGNTVWSADFRKRDLACIFRPEC